VLPPRTLWTRTWPWQAYLYPLPRHRDVRAAGALHRGARAPSCCRCSRHTLQGYVCVAVCHDSFLWVPGIISMCTMTHIYVCVMTDFYVYHDSHLWVP